LRQPTSVSVGKDAIYQDLGIQRTVNSETSGRHLEPIDDIGQRFPAIVGQKTVIPGAGDDLSVFELDLENVLHPRANDILDTPLGESSSPFIQGARSQQL
jgi:hypothetical protein